MDIMTIPAEKLGDGSSIKVEILPTAEDIANDFARVMANKVRENNAAGRKTCFILPVGPVRQYSRFARLCNVEGISCRGLVTVNMDEYLDADRKALTAEHPMSFKGFMLRELYENLDPPLRPLPENMVYPDPDDLAAVARKIAEVGGVDIAFGGIGITGHIAFNERPEPGERPDPEEFAQSTTRVMAVARETVVVNCIFNGGDLESVPRWCVTIGMKEILEAREIHFYLDWSWQAAVIRRAVHGPATPHFPASFLQRHPNCTITISEEVAALPGAAPK